MTIPESCPGEKGKHGTTLQAILAAVGFNDARPVRFRNPDPVPQVALDSEVVIALMRMLPTIRPVSLCSTLLIIILFAAGCSDGSPSDPGSELNDPDFLFEERFSSIPDGGLPSGWTIVTQEGATLEGPAEWSVSSGALHQASNVQAPPTQGLPYAMHYEGTMAIYGEEWINIAFSADMTPRDDDGIGVVFRWRESDVSSDGDFYRFLMVRDQTSGGPRIRVDKHVDGVWTILAQDLSTEYQYTENHTYRVTVEMALTQITVKLDGEKLFELLDASIPSGKIGFFCYAEEGADFDNITVYRRGP